MFERKRDVTLPCDPTKGLTIPQEFNFATNERLGLPSSAASTVDDLFEKVWLDDEFSLDFILMFCNFGWFTMIVILFSSYLYNLNVISVLIHILSVHCLILSISTLRREVCRRKRDYKSNYVGNKLKRKKIWYPNQIHIHTPQIIQWWEYIYFKYIIICF